MNTNEEEGFHLGDRCLVVAGCKDGTEELFPGRVTGWDGEGTVKVRLDDDLVEVYPRILTVLSVRKV